MTRCSKEFFNQPVPLLSRRRFLFSLTSIALLGFPGKAKGSFQHFQPFSFAVVSDTHLATDIPDSYKLTRESQLFLQDCIKTLNNSKLDFVVFLGDQVETPGKDEANWQLFCDVAQTLNCPWYFIIGEQDVSGAAYTDKMHLYGPDWKGKDINTNKPYWSLNPLPRVHLIGLDTSIANTQQGEVSTPQLAWLTKDIDEHRQQFTMVLSHHPLLPPPPFDSGSPWDGHITTNGAQVREIISSSPCVRLAISGHVHVSKIQQENHIWYISCPSLSIYPCAFRIFQVAPEQISLRTYQVNYPQLVKKAERQLLASDLAHKFNSRKRERFLDIAEGTSLDQNAIIFGANGKDIIGPLRLKKAQNF